MPRGRFPWFLALAVLSATAGLADAPTGDQSSAHRADWVRVLAPEEGGTVSGTTVHVVFEVPAETKVAARGLEIYLFLDDVLRGHTKDSQCDIKLEGVASGAHTVVLLGKSASGAMLPRKEVHFVATARDRPN